jgi:glycosyltransferase involved in cell wall biosynthesis
MQILIFSPTNSGHNIEYLEHIFQYIDNQGYSAIIALPKERSSSNIMHTKELIKIDYLESNYSCLSSENKALVINNLCIKWKIEHILFMQLDILVIPAFLKINKTTNLSCIYFEHYVRYKLISEWRFWARGIKYISKIVMNKQVRNIFVLNDKFGVKVLNSIHYYAPKFKFLPDPIDLQSKYNLAKTNKSSIIKLYCLGALHSRKNTIGVIKSLQYIPEELRSQIKLSILGQTPEDEFIAIKKEIQLAKDVNPLIKIQYQNISLTKAEFELHVAKADILAIPYIQHVGSSGILGNAVKYQKLVVGSNSGLIGALIKKYYLGITVNENDPRSIAEGITKLIVNRNNLKPDYKQFLLDFEPTPSHFSKTILQAIKP